MYSLFSGISKLFLSSSTFNGSSFFSKVLNSSDNEWRLYRNYIIKVGYVNIKDLSKLGRDF